MKQNWKPGNLLNPTPVVMLSCGLPGEKPNIITLAWVGTVCSEPPMLSVSIRKERFSHRIVKESGEFVVNLVPAALTKACDFCGVRSGRDLDKFQTLGLTAEKAPNLTQAPLIAECPVNLECRVEQVLELGSHDMFIGRIVGVQVDDTLLDGKGALKLDRANLVVYSHGEYFRPGSLLGRFGYSVRKK
jgi:flavin reductase (DIM6/NTAB) family NADH-FMN oxidoreductase RutF